MTALSSDLGARLLAARERVGLSQEDVGLLVGQPRTVVSNWETGERLPNSAALVKLSLIYRSPVEELLGTASQLTARPSMRCCSGQRATGWRAQRAMRSSASCSSSTTMASY